MKVKQAVWVLVLKNEDMKLIYTDNCWTKTGKYVHYDQ